MAVRDQTIQQSPLIPQDGDSTLLLPISLDADNGGSQNKIIRYTLSGVFAVGYILYAVSVILSEDRGIIAKLLTVVAWGILVFFVIRFPIMKERTLRKHYTEMIARNNAVDLSQLWSISSVSQDPSHLVTYRNGSLGIFVELVSDTVVGKPLNDEYHSYESIALAMREAHKLGLDVIHCDVMDFIGSDERMVKARTLLAQRASNPKMRNTITRIFNNLDTEMSYRVYSRDVYLLTAYNQPEIVFLTNVDKISKLFLQGNYRAYSNLGQEDIGRVLESLYGFSGFSVNQAIKDSYEGHNVPGIDLLKIQYRNGSIEEVMPVGKTASHKAKSKKKGGSDKKRKGLKRNKSKNEPQEFIEL